MKIAGEIIGAFAIIINFIIYQQKNRENVLKVKLLSDISWALHYGFIGAFSGMAVAIVGTARETTFLLTEDKKDKRKYFLILFAIIAVVTSSLTIITPSFTVKNLYGLLPAVASVIAVFSFWQQNPNVTKLLGIPISTAMITYDFIKFSIAGIINEILTLISIAVFFILNNKKTKTDKE